MGVRSLELAEKRRIFIEKQYLQAAYRGPDLYADHQTFAGQAKRRYYYEDGSALASPLTAQNGQSFFIGAQSYINTGGYIRCPTFIGRYCSIGRRVTIAAGKHPLHGLTTSPALQGRDSAAQSGSIYADRPTVIENDVWIGDGVVVMPGRRIGTGSVVAANAVVTRDIAPYSIVAGVPAKVIDWRFDEARRQALLESAWWDWPRSDLKTCDTTDVDTLLEQLTALPKSAGLPTYFFDNASPIPKPTDKT